MISGKERAINYALTGIPLPDCDGWMWFLRAPIYPHYRDGSVLFRGYNLWSLGRSWLEKFSIKQIDLTEKSTQNHGEWWEGDFFHNVNLHIFTGVSLLKVWSSNWTRRVQNHYGRRQCEWLELRYPGMEILPKLSGAGQCLSKIIALQGH